MSENISPLLSTVAPGALIVALWVMAQISRRFGEVTHRPPFYRVLYGAMALAAVPVIVRLLAIGQSSADLAAMGGQQTGALLHDGPLLLSLLAANVVAWRYWGWLIYAQDGQVVTPPKR